MTTLIGEMDQVIPVVGAVLILAGFAAAQRQRGFLLLEAVWAAVSLWSLVRVVRVLPVAGAH